MVYATDDEAAFDPADEALNPSGGKLVALRTRAAIEYDGPYIRAWLGIADGSAIRDSLPFVARVGAIDSGYAISAQPLENRLDLAGVDRFEVGIGARLSKARQPKMLYGE